MSREEDVLFCKIAITAKKITQEDAQKCLALANRFEAEGKPRPQVGDLFLTKNLLSDDDVLRIYGAVQKRLVAQGGAPAAAVKPAARTAGARPASGLASPRAGSGVGRPGSGVRGSGAGGGSGARSISDIRSVQPISDIRPAPVGRPIKGKRAPGEPIDPMTLWMGIIFGVIALGCIIAIFWLVLFRSPAPAPGETQGGLMKSAPAVLPVTVPVPPGTGAAPAAKAAAPAPAPVTPGAVIPERTPAVTPPAVTPEGVTPAGAPPAPPAETPAADEKKG